MRELLILATIAVLLILMPGCSHYQLKVERCYVHGAEFQGKKIAGRYRVLARRGDDYLLQHINNDDSNGNVNFLPRKRFEDPDEMIAEIECPIATYNIPPPVTNINVTTPPVSIALPSPSPVVHGPWEKYQADAPFDPDKYIRENSDTIKQ